jgi:hypothetical protein
MKHILNNLSEQEKNSIREQHTGGMKVMTENFNKLINSKLGDSKPLVSEQPSGLNTDKGFNSLPLPKNKTNDKGFNSLPLPKNKTNDKGFNSFPPIKKTNNGKQTEMVKDPITGESQKVMDITTLGHDLKFDVNKNIKFYYDDVTKSFEVVDMDNKIRYNGNLK